MMSITPLLPSNSKMVHQVFSAHLGDRLHQFFSFLPVSFWTSETVLNARIQNRIGAPTHPIGESQKTNWWPTLLGTERTPRPKERNASSRQQLPPLSKTKWFGRTGHRKPDCIVPGFEEADECYPVDALEGNELDNEDEQNQANVEESNEESQGNRRDERNENAGLSEDTQIENQNGREIYEDLN